MNDDPSYLLRKSCQGKRDPNKWRNTISTHHKTTLHKRRVIKNLVSTRRGKMNGEQKQTDRQTAISVGPQRSITLSFVLTKTTVSRCLTVKKFIGFRVSGVEVRRSDTTRAWGDVLGRGLRRRRSPRTGRWSCRSLGGRLLLRVGGPIHFLESWSKNEQVYVVSLTSLPWVPSKVKQNTKNDATNFIF